MLIKLFNDATGGLMCNLMKIIIISYIITTPEVIYTIFK